MSEIMDPTSVIAQSCCVRLSRNYADVPFLQRMGDHDYETVIERTENALIGESYTLKRMATLSKNARACLVEEQRISPELAAHDNGAVLLNEARTVSVMLGEEDHLCIQALLPGLQLHEAMQLVGHAERTIERTERFAFDEKWGYLTSRPANAGTGLRASVILHLPGLCMLTQMGLVLRSVSQRGLTLRGLYGEGLDAPGHLYLLSNEATLGKTEEELLTLVSEAAGQIVEKERAARQALLERDRVVLEDQLMRSCGVFANARLMTMKEFMNRLSNARLAADLGFIPVTQEKLTELMREVQPATLERNAGRTLTQKENDILRAEIIRKRLIKM